MPVSLALICDRDDVGRTDVSLHCPMATLAERWKQARLARDLTMNQLDKLIKRPQFTTKIEAGKTKDPGLESIVLAAKELHVRAAWLAFGEGPMDHVDQLDVIANLPAVTLVSRLGKLPKLVSEIENKPMKDWRVWHLASLVHDLGEHPSLATDDGNPIRGTWTDMLDEKRLPKAKVLGGADRMRASHHKEHPPTRKSRKNVHTPSKKHQ